MSNPFEQAKAAGPTWEKRREALLERLQTKVETILDLKRLVSETDEKTPESEIRERLGKFADGAARAAGPEVVERLRDLQRLEDEEGRLRQELDAMDAEFEARGIGEDERYDDETYSSLSEAFSKAYLRVERSKSDADVRFLADMENIAVALQIKNQEARPLAEAGDRAAIAAFAERVGVALAPEDVREVIYGAFDIGFIVGAERYEELIGKDSRGRYHSGTPFYVVKDAAPSTTIAHERMHNLADASMEVGSGNVSHNARSLSEVSLKLVEDLKSHALVRRAKARLDRLDPWDFIDAERDELTAALEAAEEKDFGGPSVEGPYAFPYKLMVSRMSAFSTAGHRLEEVCAVLKRKGVEHKDDPGLRAAFKAKSESLRETFDRYAGGLRSAFRVAERIGPAAAEEIHALTVIMAPRQVGHLRRYLVHRFSETAVRKAETRSEMTSAYLTVDRVASLAQTLREDPETLNAAEAEALAERLSRYDFAETEFLGLTSVEACEAYLEDLRFIAATLGRPKMTDWAETSVWYQYSFKVFEEGIGRDFAGLPDVYARLSEPAKEQFATALETYLEEYFFMDLSDAMPEEEEVVEDPKSIPKRPHWEAIRKMGLEERMRKYLER